jgi:two-component system, NtrC family, response regulator GlrR
MACRRRSSASSALAAAAGPRWPGNVRELANVCEAALLLVRSDSIERDDIEAVLPGTTAPAAAAVDPDGDDGADDADAVLSTPSTLPTLREARDAAERSYLDQLLRHTGGNVSRAARIADRNRTDLHELLKRHGLTPTTYRS